MNVFQGTRGVRAPDAPRPTAGERLGLRPPLSAAAWPTGVTAAAVLLLPPLTSAYWIQVLTAAAVFSVAALGLSVLYGRVGLISLGQIAMLAVGGWTAERLGQNGALPFPLVLLVTGLVTGLLGIVIGLPALRLSGLYLALITLMLAAAVTIVLTNANFPNGGKGFLGYDPVKSGTVPLARPDLAASDTAYFRYTVVVCALMFLLAIAHTRGRPGRAWAAIRQSEHAAMAAGINVTLYKLWAFALACFMTGVAGALLAASAGGLTVYQFPPQESITLLAALLMAGMYNFAGAVIAGLMLKAMPALLDTWGVSGNVLLILFGVGLVQTLVTSPEGIAGQLGRDLGRLATRMRRSAS
ncbi:branched-chain amino acid ABC transporter permease [Streptomyces sp. GbtcB7]|uniref:branched-chain amino acid ABC transporter permease n=1 Tax=Streptomyces sp. GbtcB7 TaxID=2824752 RepID=UPI001C30DAC0|nr:branched-chain amino acid ABC transporter permease [Streptomyces sp. GbtcB7]